MQNPILKFRQSSIISEKPGYLSEKLETLMSSNQEFNIFSEILHMFLTWQCLQKGVCDFFKFCLNLEFLINLASVSLEKPDLFWFWQITQNINKIKNYWTHFCRLW